jgi:hypothetical protein
VRDVQCHTTFSLVVLQFEDPDKKRYVMPAKAGIQNQ